jgi:hypothetical protein
MRRLIDQARNPAQEKRERQEAPTVRDLIDRYIADQPNCAVPACI